MRILSLVLLVLVSCGGGGADGPRPVVALISPLPEAVTEAASITVLGTAQGATSVLVDGKPASSKDGFATWTATLELHSGRNEFVIEARDDAGATTRARHAVQRRWVVSDAQWFTYDRLRKVFYTTRLDPGALVTIRNGEAFLTNEAFAAHNPWNVRRQRGAYSAARESVFIYDPERAELVSWYEETNRVSLVSSASRGTGPEFETRLSPQVMAVDDQRESVILLLGSSVFEIDLGSGDRTEIALPESYPIGMAYDSANQVLYSWHGSRPWPVWATNLNTGASTRVLDSTNWRSATPMEIDAANNRLLVALGNQSGDDAYSIQAYDLDSGASSTIASHDIVSPRDLILDDGVLFLLEADYTRNAIHRFDLASGERFLEWRSGRGAGPQLGWSDDLSFDPVRNRLVVASRMASDSSLLLVDPVTGDRETWAPSVNSTRSVDYDATRDQFVVGRIDELAIVGRGGETPLASASDIGRPEGLVIDPGNRIGWYWDDQLIRFDLATGDRETLDAQLEDARAMHFDSTRNALFLRNDEEHRPLRKLDLATGELTTVPVGFDEVSSLTMLPNGGNLLVAVRDELYEVAPDSGLAMLRSGPMMGAGPTLGYGIAMVLDPRDPNRLYVLSSDYQIQIAMVDLRTGDRYLVSK